MQQCMRSESLQRCLQWYENREQNKQPPEDIRKHYQKRSAAAGASVRIGLALRPV